MTPLEAEIRSVIAADGPIPVSRYVALCLGHPQHGYYVTRDPFGAAGVSRPRPRSARCSAS